MVPLRIPPSICNSDSFHFYVNGVWRSPFPQYPLVLALSPLFLNALHVKLKGVGQEPTIQNSNHCPSSSSDPSNHHRRSDIPMSNAATHYSVGPLPTAPTYQTSQSTSMQTVSSHTSPPTRQTQISAPSTLIISLDQIGEEIGWRRLSYTFFRRNG